MAERSRPATGPGVSAEQLVAAVRVHADRVHDAVRRLGCGPETAVDVVETSALDLVEAVATRPETVADAVGWWFARARELGRRQTARRPDLPLGGGVLSVDAGQEVLAEALEQLPEQERVALLLRDSYDLPVASVAAALGTGPSEAMELVGWSRLALIPLVDDELAPELPDHQRDLPSLARLGEGGQVAARDATVRRHALSCAGCRAVADAQERAHLLLTGLTVVVLPEAERSGLLSRVEDAAWSSLPDGTALLLPGTVEEHEEEDDDDPRLFSPLLALLCLLLAGVLGVGVGLLLTRSADAPLVGAGTSPEEVLLVSPQPTPPPATASPPTLTFPAPETSVFTITPSPSPVPAPAPVPEPLAVAVTPAAGPDGAAVTVSGTGWTAGATVLLQYLDPTGTPTGSQATAVVDPAGRFSAPLTAEDPNDRPGRHLVRASSGETIVEAPYDVAG